MGLKDDTRQLGRDMLADARDLVREWTPSAMRFVLFVLVLRHVVGMAHQQAVEVAALLAFADVATHSHHPQRVTHDLLQLRKGKKTVTRKRTTRER